MSRRSVAPATDAAVPTISNGAMVGTPPSRSPRQLRSPEDCVVSFTSQEYFYDEDSGMADLDVIRLGDLSSSVACDWHTVKGNARPKLDYLDSGGTLTFAPGERHKRIAVPLISTIEWAQDTHFEVGLKDARAVGCDSKAGTALLAFFAVDKARVWLVNQQPYPGGLSEDPTPEFLLHKFFLERCVKRGVKVKQTVYCYVYKAFYDTALKSVCLAFLFDAAEEGANAFEASEADDDGAPRKPDILGLGRHGFMRTAAAATAVLVLGTAVAQYCDFLQLDKRGRSGTRKDLRNWLVAHYMQLGFKTVKKEECVDPGHMMNASNNYVEEAVVKGWYQLFLIIEAVCGLFFTLFTVLYLSIDDDTGIPEWRVAAPMVPAVALSLYAALSREKENVRLVEVRREREDDWIAKANEVLQQSSLIRTFGKQEFVAHQFKGIYEAFYKDHRKHRKFEKSTVWRAHWYNGAIYYLLLFLGPAWFVPRGLMGVAAFVVVMKCYAKVDKYAVKLLKGMSCIQRASIALEAVRGILNLPTQGDELSDQPNFQYLPPQEWTLSELIGLTAFLFCNNKNPYEVPAPEILANAAADAAAEMEKASNSLRDSLSAGMVSLMSSDDDDDEKLFTKPGADPEAAVAVAASSAAGKPGKFPRSDKTGMAAGTCKKNEWMFYASSLSDLDAIALRSVTLTNSERGHNDAEAHGAVVLGDVTLEIPLGKFYALTGGAPQVGKGVGRGVFLEVLCGMRLVDQGVVGLPPQIKSVLLTADSATQFLDATVEECILFGAQDPASVPPEAVKAACALAGVPHRYVDEFEESRKHRALRCPCIKAAEEAEASRVAAWMAKQAKGALVENDQGLVACDAAPLPRFRHPRCPFKVGTGGRYLRTVDRAALAFARALVADPELLIVNRAEGALAARASEAFYDALKVWANEGLPGLPTHCAGLPRKRTVILAFHGHDHQPPPQCAAELRLGSGPEGTGLEVRQLGGGEGESAAAAVVDI